MNYNVDVVMVIDATASMGGLIDKVKCNANSFHGDLTAAMEQKGKKINQLRCRVIVFRDYDADGVSNAMMATDFYNLPEQTQSFQNAVDLIEAKGVGDDPEDGLEALAFAIKSDWNREGQKRRQIIVVWSDDGTHPLGKGPKMYMPGYPSRMPRSFDELTNLWDSPADIDYNAKRLILFTPDREAWSDISNSWDQVIHYPSEAGNGLEDVNYDVILNEINNSI